MGLDPKGCIGNTSKGKTTYKSKRLEPFGEEEAMRRFRAGVEVGGIEKTGQMRQMKNEKSWI